MTIHTFDFTDKDGNKFCAELFNDEDMPPPWVEYDNHGPVTGWTSRPKAPSELILSSERGSYLFYDIAAATKQAITDGWGFLPYPLVTGNCDNGNVWAQCAGPDFSAREEADDINTAIHAVYKAFERTFPNSGAYRAAAARADFDRLRAYCDGDWHYVVVKVSPYCDCCEQVDDTYANYLGGIESDSEEYIKEVALELAGEIDK